MLQEFDEAEYIGTYENDSPAESLNPNDYTWSIYDSSTSEQLTDIDVDTDNTEEEIANTDAITYATEVANNYIQVVEIDDPDVETSPYVGELDAEMVNVKNLNADNITTGTLSADRIDTDSLATSDLFSKDITATNFNLAGGSINIESSSENIDVIQLNHNTEYSGGIRKFYNKLTPNKVTVARESTSLDGELKNIYRSIIGTMSIRAEFENSENWAKRYTDIYPDMILMYNTSTGNDDTVVIQKDGNGLYVENNRDGSSAKTRLTVYGDIYANQGQVQSSSFRVNGHASNIGYVFSQAVSSGTTLSNTTKSVASITLSKGTWIVTGRVILSGTTSANTSIQCNIHRTSGQAYYQNTNYAPSGYYLSSTINNIFEITVDSQTVHLNARASTGTPTLSTDSGLTAVRIA